MEARRLGDEDLDITWGQSRGRGLGVMKGHVSLVAADRARGERPAIPSPLIISPLHLPPYPAPLWGPREDKLTFGSNGLGNHAVGVDEDGSAEVYARYSRLA